MESRLHSPGAGVATSVDETGTARPCQRASAQRGVEPRDGPDWEPVVPSGIRHAGVLVLPFGRTGHGDEERRNVPLYR